MVDSPSQESDGRLPRRRLACGVFHGHGRKNGLTPFFYGFPKELGHRLRRSAVLAVEEGFFFPKATTAVAMSHRFPCALCTLLLDYESSVWQRPTPSQ